MPIYRALSQNTYKFVQETTININQDIDNAGRNFAIPCIKLLNSSNVPIAIGVLSPIEKIDNYYNSATSLHMKAANSEPTDTGIAYSAHGYVDVDGVRYVGVKNAKFQTCFYYLPTGNNYIIPACTITIVKYNSTSGLIETEVVNKAQINHIQPSNYNYSYVSLTVQKQRDDLILGINIEFAS